MSGPIGTLIYTDCPPGRGLAGFAGLQFQARSSDPVAMAEPTVREYLLYEAPSRWMGERRPVEQYPPSFAHVSVDGLYATAAGVYLGREANGGREGNQLTHSLVTKDPADYAGLRPAQLFGAPFWRSTPSESTTCDALGREELTTYLTPVRARDFVRSQHNGVDLLLALVSVLEQAGGPGGPRVLFVGDDVATIMEWLVAGTLLVPRPRALELGFKIFSTDPARAGVPIIGVHPEFAGTAARLDNELGYAVFDLRSLTCTPVEIRPHAQRWVPLFLSEDPRDVVDALDVAAVSLLHPPQTAAAFGLAAIMHRAPAPEHAEAIVDWLRTGPEQLRIAYAAGVAEMFAELFRESPDTWPQRVLVLLDAVGCDGLIPGNAAGVRIALIHSEAADARNSAAVTDRLLPQLPAGEWTVEDDNVARRIIVNAIHEVARPAGFDALLRVASRFGLGLRLADIAAPAEAFVRHWAEHPELDYDPSRWPCGGELRDALIGELTMRIAQDGRYRKPVGNGWWRWLRPRLDRLDPALAAAVLGGTVRNAADRATFVHEQLAGAARDPDRFGWTVEALWSLSQPTDDELRLLLDLAPDGVTLSQRVFAGLADRLNGTVPLTIADVDLGHRLRDAGLLLPDRAVARLLADDRELTATVADLAAGAVADGAAAVGVLRRIQRLPARLVRLRATAVAGALVRLAEFGELITLLAGQPDLAQRFAEALAVALRDVERDRCAAVAFVLIYAERVEPALRLALDEPMQRWTIRASGRAIGAVANRLAALGPRWAASWDDHVAGLRRRRRAYRLTHPLGGR